ncbi:MAG: MFS transporter [Candidatus Aenigmarchaeota archaeon]|nr:MFS transporter [Candidatus Aenigmarchaeota archaeon]
MVAYTFITSLMELYILQIINGMTEAIQQTMTTAFLADVTKKKTRGTDIGTYNAIIGIMVAFALMFGGFIVAEIGFKFMFYAIAAIIAASTLLLMYITE